MRTGVRAGEQLGLDDALDSGQPDRPRPVLGPAAGRGFQRQGVGGIGRDLTGPDGAQHLVLADRAEHRMGPERHDRRQRQQLHVPGQAGQQRVLGAPDRAPRGTAGPGEPVEGVAALNSPVPVPPSLVSTRLWPPRSGPGPSGRRTCRLAGCTWPSAPGPGCTAWSVSNSATILARPASTRGCSTTRRCSPSPASPVPGGRRPRLSGAASGRWPQ